jgi:membrane-associated phospholipid phosphatase
VKRIKYFVTVLVLLSYSKIWGESYIEKAGDVLQFAIPAYAAGLTAMEYDYEGLKEFAFSFTATEMAVHGLKYAFREKRPLRNDRDSFPSGHTAAAFSSALFIHKRYGLKQAALPYCLAAFTGYSRVYAEEHYIHDVIGGALIAGAITYLFTNSYNSKNINVGGFYDGKYMYLSVRFDF